MTAQVKVISAKKLICVTLDIHLWGGRQALKREHLQAYDSSISTLPPSALASMGSVKICDPEEVRVFQRLKNEAIRLLEDNGLPLLGAIGIPDDKFDSVYQSLQTIGAKFDAAAQDLFLRYDQQVDAWRTKWKRENPGNTHLLGRIPDAQSVCGKLNFGFHCYAVEQPVGAGEHAANGTYVSQLQGLKGELFKACAAEANDLLTKYLIKSDGSSSSVKEAITQKTLRPLKRTMAKLRSFSFVDPSANALAELIEWSLRQVPDNGPITGPGLISIWSLARTLADPVEAARIAEVSMTFGPEMAWNGAQQQPTATVTTGQSAIHVEPPRTQVVVQTESLESVAHAIQPDSSVAFPSIQPVSMQPIEFGSSFL